jgi:hypothetical protein
VFLFPIRVIVAKNHQMKHGRGTTDLRYSLSANAAIKEVTTNVRETHTRSLTKKEPAAIKNSRRTISSCKIIEQPLPGRFR